MDLNPPIKVYKYMNPKYLRMLEETGDIRLSYLESYDQSVHGSEIGDDSEGITQSSIHLDEYTVDSNTSDRERKILGVHGFTIEDSNVQFTDVEINRKFIDTNYFVLCVCLNYSSDLKKHFGRGLQRIDNFPEFVKRLSRLLAQQDILIQDMGECIYLPKREQKFDASHLVGGAKDLVLQKPYFVKDERYSYQQEYRVLWKYRGDKKITEPVMVKDNNRLSDLYQTMVLPPNNFNSKKKKKKKK